jgi:hypothetical protein
MEIMTEYIKRVGEDHGKDLRKALAQRLQEQQSESMPEIRAHSQGLAEVLKRGLAGWEAGSTEQKYDQEAKESKAAQMAESANVLRALGYDPTESMGNSMEMPQGKSQAPNRGGEQMMPQGTTEVMQGRKPQLDLKGMTPHVQNIAIERDLKDRDQTRKEKFQMNENQKNRDHAFALAQEKSKLGTGAHKENKRFDSEEAKLVEMEEAYQKGQEANAEIDQLLSMVDEAKPGVAFEPRLALLNGISSVFGDKAAKEIGLGDTSSMQALKKGLSQLVIGMAKQFGSRVLQIEVQAVQRALPDVDTNPTAMKFVLNGLKRMNLYKAMRSPMANNWVKKYGSLRATNEAEKNFQQAYESYAQHKWFSPKVEEQPVE